MLTIRSAAELLNACSSTAGAARIADVLGFSPPDPLDATAAERIGAGAPLTEVQISRGNGSLRALIFSCPAESAPRELLAKLAPRIAARAPHVSWLLIGVDATSRRVLIAAPHAGPRSTRVAALIVERTHVLDSDADTVRSLAAAASDNDLATHARFVEVLGRDALSRRFFRTLRDCVDELARSATTGREPERREIALLHVSRLLFLAFLESKGWLDSDPAFIAHAFDDCMLHGGRFHSHVLLPLFFGTLNTPVSKRALIARRFGRVPFLNGGLFTPTSIERTHRPLRFGDEALGRFVGELLGRYRFTAREETSTFEEAAIDPEMLGRTFESLMATESRQSTGAFYTPHDIVRRVADAGLAEGLAAQVGDTAARRLIDGEALHSPEAQTALARLRVLDPACGSGAFLVHVLDRLTGIHRAAGDHRPAEQVRRQVLARSIFGVDVNPTAVWLCQLRLWLSVVIDTPNETSGSVPPLPNLDRNIRVGDALSGEDFSSTTTGARTVRQLRERYARSSGRRKGFLCRMLDREERRIALETLEAELSKTTALRRDLLSARRGRDLFGERRASSLDERRASDDLRLRSAELRSRLKALRKGGALPFSFAAHFADVTADGGFSIIVGNPPWVRPHRIDVAARESLRRAFIVARAASWTAGAEAAGAGRGFASQVDLAALFVERSLRLLMPGGALSLLLPSKLFRSLAAGGMRGLLWRDTLVTRLEDYSGIPTSFDAAVYPGLLVARRQAPADRAISVSILHRTRVETTASLMADRIAFDASPGSPWLLLPPQVRAAFDRLRNAGAPLSDTSFGRPLLGVKCGLNEAFLVRRTGDCAQVANIQAANGRDGTIEADMLRPVIRGEDVQRWKVDNSGDSIIWTHSRVGPVLPELPPRAARWLKPHRRALSARSDAKRASRWWSLFRTDAAAHAFPRVVWADIGKELRAAVLPADDQSVPLNTCYVVRARCDDDAHALCALLNSNVATAWLSMIAEPARGGYRRYMGWTLALLPTPRDWDSARTTLADLGRRAASGDPPSSTLLNEAVAAAYGIRRCDLDPLLAWAAS